MRIEGVEWDAGNRAHFAAHGRCAERDVEEVLLALCHPTRSKAEPGKRGVAVRRRFVGQACNGRTLTVIAELRPGHTARPITGWPLRGGRLEKYLAWRRSLPR